MSANVPDWENYDPEEELRRKRENPDDVISEDELRKLLREEAATAHIPKIDRNELWERMKRKWAEEILMDSYVGDRAGEVKLKLYVFQQQIEPQLAQRGIRTKEQLIEAVIGASFCELEVAILTVDHIISQGRFNPINEGSEK